MRAILLSVGLFLTIVSAAQPTIQWAKNYGGSKDEFAHAVIQTADKGYAFAGYSQSNNMDIDDHQGTTSTKDFWIMKTDSAGGVSWKKSLGGTQDDIAYSIIQTKDGGYVAVGLSQSNDGDVTDHRGTTANADYWVVKMNASGVVQWEKSLGGTYWDEARSVIEMESGNLLVVGSTSSNNNDVTGLHGAAFYNSDLWVLKLNPDNGNIIWKKCFGGSSYDYGYDIALSTSGGADAGCIIAGVSSSTDGDISGTKGGYDYCVIKLDTMGNKVWQKTLGGSASDVARTVIEDKEGNVIVGGRSGSNNIDISSHHGSSGVSDYWIVKLNASGTAIVWESSLGGSSEDEAWDIQQTADGGYVIGGSSASNDGDISAHYGPAGINDQWLLKLNIYGGLIWERSFGGSSSDELYGLDICADGSAVIAGGTYSTDNDVAANYGLGDCWMVKLDATVTGLYELNNTLRGLTLYPNPVVNYFNLEFVSDNSENVQVQVFNMLGEVLLHKSTSIAPGENQLSISLPELANGIYSVRIFNQNAISQIKFIKD